MSCEIFIIIFALGILVGYFLNIFLSKNDMIKDVTITHPASW
jgi:uncharacterized protein YneF (UPF0154 family)